MAVILMLFAACSSNNKPSSTDGADSTAANPDKVYEISFSMHDPATSAKLKYYQELADKTKAATNGGLKITIYPSGTLVAGTDAAEGVLSGATDMGWLFTAFFPGQFPILEAISLPMITDDSIVGTKVIQALYEESEELQAELSQYKILGIYCNPINYIYTADPVYTVSDLAGLTLRCPAGVVTDTVAAWGGTPILMGPGDMYQSIEKKVIGGYVFEWSGVGTYKLAEVTNYCTELPVNVGTFVVAMNIDKWNSLPEEYQQVIEEIWCTNEASLDLAQIFIDDMNVARDDAINNQGVTIITPTTEQIATFKPAAETYIKNWISSSSTSTFDAQAYYNTMIELIEEFSS